MRRARRADPARPVRLAPTSSRRWRGPASTAGATSISPVLLHLRPGVREHYLRTLAETRPDLVELHERRYARGAYGPAQERERVARLVHDLARRHRRAPRSR